MDKDELLKSLSDIYEFVLNLEDDIYKVRQDLFGLIDDVEIHLIDAES